MHSFVNHSEQWPEHLSMAIFTSYVEGTWQIRKPKTPSELKARRIPVADSTSSPEVREKQQFWYNPGACTVCPPNFSAQILEREYVFKDHREVKEYIEINPFLIPLLFEAYGKIKLYFESYPQVFLEVVTDPEVPDDIKLVAFIRTCMEPKEALDRLDRLDREWWLQAMERAQGKLCIHLEFV